MRKGCLGPAIMVLVLTTSARIPGARTGSVLQDRGPRARNPRSNTRCPLGPDNYNQDVRTCLFVLTRGAFLQSRVGLRSLGISRANDSTILRDRSP